jgi:pyruvate dehydrogenase E2 component (dihydrolipoamide acetyltransferase)
MVEFKLPSLGADMQAGTLLEWLIKPGDTVSRGKIVAVVDTEKAAIDVEIWIDGTVEKLLVAPGTRIPVGTPIAIIRATGAAAGPAPVTQAAPSPSQPPPQRSQAFETQPARAKAPAPGAAPSAEPPARQRVTPLARRIAQQLKVDLTHVAGTGPQGAVTRSDVEQAAAAPRRETAAPAPAPLASGPAARPSAMTGKERGAAMRRAIAGAMARSKREIPHYYLGLQINLERALTWLEEENQARSIEERLLYSVLLIKAVARAVQDVPEMNGFFIEDAFQPAADVHVGMAISLRHGGLIAPALLDANRKSTDELMRELRDLVQRARSGSLRSTELSAPTITVTNLGEQGVDSVFGIIFPPQVALVGFGRISPLRTLHASLSADHRVSDGHRGGLYLAAIDRYLQYPETL